MIFRLIYDIAASTERRRRIDVPALSLSLLRAVSAQEELALIEKTNKNVDFNSGKSTVFIFLPYLEELHANTGKHKLEQRGDDDDVADGPDGHKHALHHMLEPPGKTKGQHTLDARHDDVMRACANL